MKRPSWRILVYLAAALLVGLATCLVIRQFCGIENASLEPYRESIWKYSQENSLPTGLVEELILVESGGDPRAISRHGAKGLMQVTTVAERDVLERLHIAKGNLLNPDYNIRLGTKYLRMMLDQFGGDAYLAVAAYNAGPTRVQQLRREHPDLSSRQLIDKYAPGETVSYCRRIIGERTPPRL